MFRWILLVPMLLAGMQPSPSPAQPSDASGPAAGTGTHLVVIEGFKFLPAQITVKAGDVVEWINHDFAPHTATVDGEGWGTEMIRYGMTARLTMLSPGTFAYHCQFHPEMRGVVAVTANDPASSR